MSPIFGVKNKKPQLSCHHAGSQVQTFQKHTTKTTPSLTRHPEIPYLLSFDIFVFLGGRVSNTITFSEGAWGLFLDRGARKKTTKHFKIQIGVFPKLVVYTPISHPKCWSFFIWKTHGFVGVSPTILGNP